MILARVQIGDWDQFWGVFTGEGADRRRDHGSAGVRVLRNEDDQSEVWLLLDWPREKFESFLSDPDVRETMKKSGAQGPPEVKFVELVEDLQV